VLQTPFASLAPLDLPGRATYNRDIVAGRVMDGRALRRVGTINALQDLGEVRKMSFEVFEKLEAKVQQAIDTITLLQMEIEELKEQNNTLKNEVQQSSGNQDALVRENQQLKEEQHVWQDRLRALLGKMEEV
jgi:cell division protein ZapB